MLTAPTLNLNLNFDDFAKASEDKTLACPLTQKLDVLAKDTEASIAKAYAIIKQVENDLTHSDQIQEAIHQWQLSEIEEFLGHTITALKEERTLTIDKEFVLKALYGTKYPDNHWDRSADKFRLAIFSVWDPAKLIHARNLKFGNLAEAEKKELFKKVARFVSRSQDDADTDPKQVNFHFHFFREETYEKGVIRHSYQRFDYEEAFNSLLRLVMHYATGKALDECFSHIPLIFSLPGPFTSAELYRWHKHDAPGITRLRFYKGGRFLLELKTSDIKDRFLNALRTYTAEEE